MKITNRKAYYDYTILETFEAGITLVGGEVKAVRLGSVDLTGSFVKIVGRQAYLLNAKIFPYTFARPDAYDTTRTRKLLLHKQELIALKSKMDGSNLTIVPISLYTTHGIIKLELGLGKSKKKFDKKETIKQRDIDRDIELALKENV